MFQAEFRRDGVKRSDKTLRSDAPVSVIISALVIKEL